MSLGAPELLILLVIGLLSVVPARARHLDRGRREPATRIGRSSAPGRARRSGSCCRIIGIVVCGHRRRSSPRSCGTRRTSRASWTAAAPGGARSGRRRIGSAHDRRPPAVPRRGSRRGARRPARPAGAHALARPDPGLAAGTTAPTSRTCRTCASTGATKFDWRAQEDAVQPLAALPHRHRRPAGPLHPRALAGTGRVPAVITHGWPGSVAGVPRRHRAVVRPARTAAIRGRVPRRRARRSPATDGRARRREPGWDVQRVAEAWKTLMARLGYDRYGAQGGDWGAMISAHARARRPRARRRAAQQHAAGVPGQRGRARAHRRGGRRPRGGRRVHADAARAYQEIQGKNPQTLGYGLTDSPAGLAGWIVEKFRAWTDNDGNPEDAVTRDQILTNLTVYWVTKTINSSVRLYCESQRSRPLRPDRRVRRGADRGRGVPEGDVPHPAGVRRDRASTSCATTASTAAATSPRSRSPTC